jgi:hypothetical protein
MAKKRSQPKQPAKRPAPNVTKKTTITVVETSVVEESNAIDGSSAPSTTVTPAIAPKDQPTNRAVEPVEEMGEGADVSTAEDLVLDKFDLMVYAAYVHSDSYTKRLPLTKEQVIAIVRANKAVNDDSVPDRFLASALDKLSHMAGSPIRLDASGMYVRNN